MQIPSPFLLFPRGTLFHSPSACMSPSFASRNMRATPRNSVKIETNETEEDLVGKERREVLKADVVTPESYFKWKAERRREFVRLSLALLSL